MVKFTEDNHSYTSDDDRKWTSVTGIISKLKTHFDAEEQAKKSSKNSKSKWFGIPPKEIEAVWNRIGENAVNKGKIYHFKREMGLYDDPRTIAPNVNGGVKTASDQRLERGKIYPEHLVYLASANICGQVDKVEVNLDTIDINDYKTSREIKRQGYKGYDGTKKLLTPVAHLDECEFNVYSLQLSLYAYMILQHNPSFRVGKLTIEHIKFIEEEGKDKYGYPLYKLDQAGDPIVKEIELIEVPYKHKEVIAILKWLKNQ